MKLVSTVIQWFTNIVSKVLVKSKLVPEHPLTALNIDATKPIFYISQLNSYADMSALRAMCLKLGLPDPQAVETIGNHQIKRYIPIHNRSPLFGNKRSESPALAIGSQLFQAINDTNQHNLQVIPVTILWGRNPGKEKPGLGTLLSSSITPSWLRKTFVVLFSGRDNLIRFSQPVDLAKLSKDRSNMDLAHKLVRVARVHFKRQKLATLGPKLPSRDQLYQGLLASSDIKKAIADEARAKNITAEQAKQNAIKLMDEIAANYNESMIGVGDRVLTWFWNKLYNGIEVNKSERIQELTDKGHEIIYMPCHRSHMDYLLLTYVIYHQGFVPPHIAAGINLSFWPAGPIFRRCGAFFLRRTFKGNKLYSTIFREYLTQLFIKGYSVKFYTEGGRSRTGRLLSPKTGMLAMTLQSILRGVDRPISIVPVYIGYEHVMEVNTYLGELAGQKKKKESVLGVFKTLRKLKNYGKGNVNFGEPININQYLNQHQPDWRATSESNDKPKWLTPAVGKLADDVMVKINNAAAINAVTLISCILLSTDKHAITKDELLKLMENLLTLFNSAHYDSDISLPTSTPKALLEHALTLDKFEQIDQGFNPVIKIKQEEAVLLNYYRNNVQHLFAIPSLICLIVLRNKSISIESIHRQIVQLYPLFQQELFMKPYSKDYIDATLLGLQQIGLIKVDKDAVLISESPAEQAQLKLLSQMIHCTLIRYASVLKIIEQETSVSREILEENSQKIAKQLAQLFDINTPEFYDKKILTSFVSSLKENSLIASCEQGKFGRTEKSTELAATIKKLLAPSVTNTLNAIRLN